MPSHIQIFCELEVYFGDQREEVRSRIVQNERFFSQSKKDFFFLDISKCYFSWSSFTKKIREIYVQTWTKMFIKMFEEKQVSYGKWLKVVTNSTVFKNVLKAPLYSNYVLLMKYSYAKEHFHFETILLLSVQFSLDIQS